MQPYLFPYIGYFQLISAADKFIILDDVQYIERGWSNRNQILNGGKAKTFTFPVSAGSRSQTFQQRHYRHSDSDVNEFKRLICASYSTAPCFPQVSQLISDIMTFPESAVAAFNLNSIKAVCRYLNIQTDFILSSEISGLGDFRGQYRIRQACLALGATCYTNPAGGVALYDETLFESSGINLSFLFSNATPYEQLNDTFTPYLSIIDVLMFNTIEQIEYLMRSYDIRCASGV